MVLTVKISFRRPLQRTHRELKSSRTHRDMAAVGDVGNDGKVQQTALEA